MKTDRQLFEDFVFAILLIALGLLAWVITK